MTTYGKPAVASLLPRSHAVLMDLRGFSSERRGCEYELRLLIDRFPIDRMLLITDQGSDRDALFALLGELWSKMSADSPNRALPAPVLAAYAPGVEDPGDVDRVLALLASRLPGLPAAGGDLPTAIAGQPPGPPPRLAWSAALGRLDLRFSSPAFARWVVPAALALLFFEAWRLLAPVHDAWRAFAAPRPLAIATLAAGPLDPSKLPPAVARPFAAAGHVFTNKPITRLNSAELQENIDVCIRLEGGPLASSGRLGEIENLAILGPDGQSLPIERPPPTAATLQMEIELTSQAVDRPWDPAAEAGVEIPADRRQFCATLYLDTLIDRIAGVSGRAHFELYPPTPGPAGERPRPASARARLAADRKPGGRRGRPARPLTVRRGRRHRDPPLRRPRPARHPGPSARPARDPAALGQLARRRLLATDREPARRRARHARNPWSASPRSPRWTSRSAACRSWCQSGRSPSATGPHLAHLGLRRATRSLGGIQAGVAPPAGRKRLGRALSSNSYRKGCGIASWGA